MCWTTYQKWRTKPHIAKRKIEVWKFYIKRCNDLLESPWQREKIFLNMRHNVLIADGLCDEHLNVECFNRGEWSIYCGFHSLKKGAFSRKVLPLTKELVIEGGTYIFHPTGLDISERVAVIQCFIPIGAEYYLNENEEYVSNKIIIGDEIPLDNLPLSKLPLLLR